MKPKHQEKRRECRGHAGLKEGEHAGEADGARLSQAVVVSNVRKADDRAQTQQQQACHQQPAGSRETVCPSVHSVTCW
jgi:hypothetical protein